MKKGYKTMICSTYSEQNYEKEYINMLNRHIVDGIIAGSHMLDFEEYQGVQGPIVALDRFLGENIPVVSTMMGIGILPSDNPRYYGMIGSHGVKRANLLFNRADLVIVMGSRLGDRTVANVKGLEEGNKLIHIDLDPAEIGKNTQPYIPVVGDIKRCS